MAHTSDSSVYRFDNTTEAFALSFSSERGWALLSKNVQKMQVSCMIYKHEN